MTERTLKWVGDKAREYPSQYGPKAALSVIFAGENGEPDQKAELKTNADKVADRLAALKELVGKTGEYELQDQGTWDDGNPKPLLIKSYPGKPGSDGGGSPNGGRSGKSPEERASIEKQVALKAAIDYVVARDTSIPPTGVVGVAEVFFSYLQGSSGATQSEGGADTSGEDSSPPAPEGTTSESEGVDNARVWGRRERLQTSDSGTTSDGGRSDSGGQAPPSEPPDFNEDALANAEQIENIKQHYGGLRSATKTAFDQYQVGSLDKLTQGQAAEMLAAKVKG